MTTPNPERDLLPAPLRPDRWYRLSVLVRFPGEVPQRPIGRGEIAAALEKPLGGSVTFDAFQFVEITEDDERP